ncbi:MAG: M4 family metallopeptidase [Acidobacteria bacterium]|nr:M4 family metallopeptidase [Acidobacteriota bacterium]
MQMRKNAIRIIVAVAALAVAVTGMAGQEPAGRRDLAATEAQVSELRRIDELVDSLTRTDELVLASRTSDRQLPDRLHEGLVQYHEGVPVHRGGISRQLAGGVTVSVFGTLHEGIDIDVTPLVPADDARTLIAQQTGVGPATGEPPSLVIVQTLRGDYVLAWRLPMADRQTYFLDAHGGRIVHEESNVFEQSASVGVGTGIQGQRKKLSTSSAGGQYHAHDRLRPAETVTLDMRHDKERVDLLIEEPEVGWLPSDVASDADNDWGDTAVVDAHAYAGFTYDYLAQRQGWNGADGADGRLMSMVNIGLDSHTAFFAPPPYGPEGTGMVAFGHWYGGTPVVSADVVAHEIMHAVSYFSVSGRTGEDLGGVHYFPGPSEFTLPDGFTPRCGESYVYPEGWAAPALTGVPFSFECDEEGRLLLFADHGGAIHEAYSDIIGTSVEFMLHEPPQGPLRADYLIAEDTGVTLRRIDDPRDIHHPDAYSGMIWFLAETYGYRDRLFTVYSRIGTEDGGRTLDRFSTWGYGGDHWNSTILSHAFYLAVEGGRNKTTGLTVQGVGGANRHDVERAYFRALTDLMPNAASMPMAASVIVQSAADLFGVGSTTHQAIGQALVAAELLPRADD